MRYWVLTNKWHAWPSGGQASVCTHLTKLRLAQNPAKKIQQAVPTADDHPICKTCAAKTGVQATQPQDLNEIETAWVRHIGIHLARIAKGHGRGDAHTKIKRLIAIRLATIGPPSDPEALAVYEQIQMLVLTPRRIQGARRSTTTLTYKYVKEALDMLPPDPAKLRHVATTMKLWRQITGQNVSTSSKFHADTVIRSMLQISNPEAYIRHLEEQGFNSLAGMFHPNTLERAKRDTSLRGAFDNQDAQYWETLKNQVKVVR